MKTLVSIVAGVWALALFSLLTSGCGPAQDPCVTAYDKARNDAEIAEVDKTCGYKLLGAGGEGGAP